MDDMSNVSMPNVFSFISHINSIANGVVYRARRKGKAYQIEWDSLGGMPQVFKTTQSIKKMYHNLKHGKYEIVNPTK